MGNGNDPPARIPYLEISDENMTSPNSGLMVEMAFGQKYYEFGAFKGARN